MIAIAGALTLPLSNFVGHPHWNKIVWVPFHERKPSGLDLLQNVLLFVPLGFFQVLAARSPRSGNLLYAVATGALLSFSGEFYQIFCHRRCPSTTDIVTNTAGAVLGAALSQLFRVAWEGEKHG